MEEVDEEKEEEEEVVPVIVTKSGKRLRFSDKLKCIWNTAEINICSLKELCLKEVYSQVAGRIVMRMAVTEDVRLHLPSVYADSSGCLTVAGLRSRLPGEVWSLLRWGPAAHLGCTLPPLT